MRSLRWLAPGALLSLVACGSVDRNALEGPLAADSGGAFVADTGPMTAVDTDTPSVHTDLGNPTASVDAGSPLPPPPPVDAGPPPPPRDAGDPTCRACTAFAPVTFCPGTGAGACLAYAGCTAEGCAVCASAMAGGDNCSNPIVLSASGQHRTVVSTCGARDDVTTGCNGRGGPDIVLGLRVARRGRVVMRMTVPAGVSVNYGYDFPARSCRDEATIRACSDNSNSTTQGFDLTLDAGTYYLYVATTVASTIVVETTLP